MIKKKKVVIERKIASTFRDDVKPTQPAKVMVTLSGGVNYGNQTNGYTVGATARRMVNKQVFVESDIAFIGTNNNTSIKYSEQVNAPGSVNPTSNVGPNVGARLSSDPSSVKAKMTNATPPPPTERDAYRKESFNLYYAQVTPSVGYMLMKHLSLAAGPDFQQMLVDNRPAPSTVDRGTITTEPVFDLGFIGKMEMGVSKNLKAAVFYREGINNIVTPMHGFIDRNYVQFQLKYAILKR